MKIKLRELAIGFLVGAVAALAWLDPAHAAPTHIQSTVSIGDPTTPTQQATVDAAGNLHVSGSVAAGTTGGCASSFHISGGSAASNNATNVKNAAGTLCGLTLVSTSGTLAYFRMYNSSSSPTCSSATGAGPSWPIPASATGAGVSPNLGPYGLNFSTGISFCITGGGTDTDNTNAPTGIYVTLIYN